MDNKITVNEQRAIFKVCLLAAFSDGDKHQAERDELKSIAERVLDESECPRQLMQDVLLNKMQVGDLAKSLVSEQSRLLAYELALLVCESDGLRSEKESEFLEHLRAALALSPAQSASLTQSADEVALMIDAEHKANPSPTPPPLPVQIQAPAADVEKSILNHAIVAAALELLPQNLATLAVIPVQMKLVHSIGSAHGYKLDGGHIKEFAATVGLGLTSQVIETHARKFLGGLVGKAFRNKFMGGVAAQAAGSAITFASTYALGKAAVAYYSAGRKIELSAIKNIFSQAAQNGKALHEKYLPQIQQQAGTMDIAGTLNLLRKGAVPQVI